MAKKRPTEKLTASDLEKIAETLQRLADQVKMASEIDFPVDVGGYSTFQLGIKHVVNWVGTLQTAIALTPMSKVGRPSAESVSDLILEKAEEIGTKGKKPGKNKSR